MKRAILLGLVGLMACAKEAATGPSGPTGVSCSTADVPASALGSKVACSAVTIGATCAGDFDCWTNQLCDNTADRTKPGKCAAATDEQKGESSKIAGVVKVATAGTYLLSVTSPADAPADSVTDAATVKYQFATARRSPVSLKRLRPITGSDSEIARALMAPRIAMESQMRGFERDALARGVTLIQPLSPSRATCADAEVSFKNACVALDGTFTLKVSFAAGTPNITVALKRLSKTAGGSTAILVDTRDTVSDADLDAILTGFDTIAAKRDRLLFNNGKAHEGYLDPDGNGVVGLVLTREAATAKLAGIFDSRDITGDNKADIMWGGIVGGTFSAGSTTVEVTRELVLATMAHEYQHLINFTRRADLKVPAETLFLNEGLSHLAEDLTGYGKSNISSVGLFLNNPLKAGMLQGNAGTDRDSSEMRGITYLYLRHLYEKAGGASFSSTGALTDRGGVAFLEKLMTASTNGITSLGIAGGSMWENLPTFFIKLAVSNQSDIAPLLSSNSTFQFAATTIDPQTSQPVGINLNDPAREDTRGDTPLKGYEFDEQACDKDKGEGDGCEFFSTGGYSIIWEGAAVGDEVTVLGTPQNLLRFVAVRIKQ